VTGRAAPFYCPYCGDEDLRPSEEGHGAWECRACNRAFRLKFLGLLADGLRTDTPDGGAS
jgi:transposase-like protein